MLNKNKEIRYCNFEQISGHVWFKDFNWDSLISLDMVPEYMSECGVKKDFSMFLMKEITSVTRLFSTALLYCGNATAAKMPIIKTTTNSSIIVKPL